MVVRPKGGALATDMMNNRALIKAFEKVGLQFIPENGGGHGIRVRERREG